MVRDGGKCIETVDFSEGKEYEDEASGGHRGSLVGHVE
jgi:hypothetical protein